MLAPLDYAVITLYLAAITAFGSWFARFQHTTRDYFLSGHSVPWWAVCCTVVATETSTLTFIGIPATAYAGNMTFLQLALGYVIGRVLVSALFIPAYFRGELVTSYQLLQRRFGLRVTRLSAGLFLVTRSLADGIRLFATALVIGVVTGVPTTWATLIVGAIMIVYTVRGGAAAVIWTDVVQMFVYVAGAAAVAWYLLAMIPGGWAEVVRAGGAADKFSMWDLSTDPATIYTLWTGLFGGVALTLATHGTDQFLVQRLLAATSARAAATGLVLSGVIVFAQFTLFLTIGVMLYTFYQHVALPGPLGRTDEILPTFVVTQLPSGLAGFIVAAIVAAALSPSLNAMAATTVTDFYLPQVRQAPDEATLVRVSRRITVAWGVVQLAVALAAQFMDRSVLDAGLAVLSFASGAVLGAFVIATSMPSVREPDALAGMAAGLLTMTVVWAATPLAWTWYVFVGALTTCGTAWLLARRAAAPPA
ncbi:MAG: sodium:solute symporter [Vicinamibacterales bacterium]